LGGGGTTPLSDKFQSLIALPLVKNPLNVGWADPTSGLHALVNSMSS